jgi:hypothetical protein
MSDLYLIPPGTVLTAKGDGAGMRVPAPGKTYLLTLKITKIVEQEALDVSVWGSVDGTTWDTKPLAVFPQKFYAGQQPLLLDLSQRSDAQFVRAHWEVNRWGRGSETPMFEVSLQMREVPAEVLRETMAEAGARR